jgi:23S rRNA G2069 N7-methylase RlmK/C1962 C5-methylase RlmI
MYMNDLIELVEQTSRSLSYKAEITKKLGAAADHPVHKLIPQTRYLKRGAGESIKILILL